MTDCYCHILTHVLLHTVEVSLCAFEKWGHVSPLSHKRGIFSFGVEATWDVTVSFTDPFSQLEVLWGPAVFWTCFFYLTYIWRLLCSFLPLCNSICQVRYRPPWTHLSAGAAVFLSSLLSACLSIAFLPSAPLQADGRGLRWVIWKSPLIWLTSLSQWGH